MHPHILRELVMSWQGTPSPVKGHGKQAKLLKTLQEVNIALVFKKEDPGNSWPVGLTSASGKVLDQILLKAMSRRMKEQGNWEQPAGIYHRETLPGSRDSLLQ